MPSGMYLISSGPRIPSLFHSDSLSTPSYWEFRYVILHNVIYRYARIFDEHTTSLMQDYFEIIRNPIDLSTIDRRLAEGAYKDGWEVREMHTMTYNVLCL